MVKKRKCEKCAVNNKKKRNRVINEYINNSLYYEVIIKRSNDEQSFYIDADDYDKVSLHNWTVSGHGYIVSSNKSKTIFLHRYILNLQQGCNIIVDHIDHNKKNNRKSNLRLCTPSENMINKQLLQSNKSGYPGIRWENNRHKWYVRICADRKEHFIGRFDSFNDALEARLNAEKLYFGEFANVELQIKQERGGC